MELPKGRERIKFRIRGEKEMHVELGVNMMNGVCKGSSMLLVLYHHC